MNLENIRKAWVLLAGILLSIGGSWLPGWAQSLLGPEGTEMVFSVVMAVIALWQFLPIRTGEKEEGAPMAKLSSKKSKVVYALNPFARAA